MTQDAGTTGPPAVVASPPDADVSLGAQSSSTLGRTAARGGAVTIGGQIIASASRSRRSSSWPDC